MIKSEHPGKARSQKAQGELYDVSLKLRGIGYLLENQTDPEIIVRDLAEVYSGIGRLVGELADRTHRIWQTWDECELKRGRPGP